MSDLHKRAKDGDVAYQRLCVLALHNYGCEHLKGSAKHYPEEWAQCWQGLSQYWDALVGEYGIPEDKAEREMVQEFNSLLKLCKAELVA
jgi:hypothetical protein